MSKNDQGKTKDFDAGIELDKLDFDSLNLTLEDEPFSERKIAKFVKKFRKKSDSRNTGIAILIFVIIFILAGAAFFWQKEQMNLSFVFGKKQDSYATVGPVVLNAGDELGLQFSLKMETKNEDIKNIIKLKSSAIRSQLLLYLSSEKAQKLLKNKEYTILKKEFRIIINETLGAEYVDEVFFSDLLIFK